MVWSPDFTGTTPPSEVMLLRSDCTTTLSGSKKMNSIGTGEKITPCVLSGTPTLHLYWYEKEDNDFHMSKNMAAGWLLYLRKRRRAWSS